MQELLAAVGIETWGRWTIAAIGALIGVIGSWGIKYYWERRSRTPRFKHSVNVHTRLSSSTDPALVEPALHEWVLTITNDGQVPITVTGVTFVLPLKGRPDYSIGVYHAYESDRGRTIAASAREQFYGLSVNLQREPWRQLAAAHLTRKTAPYFRIVVTGDHHEIRLTPAEVAHLINLSR